MAGAETSTPPTRPPGFRRPSRGGSPRPLPPIPWELVAVATTSPTLPVPEYLQRGLLLWIWPLPLLIVMLAWFP